MTSRALIALACAALVSCGESPPRAAAPGSSTSSPSEAPSDADACARICTGLDRCGPSAGCVERCSHDVAPMRAGFASSFAACVDHELTTRGCGDDGRRFADRRATACYFAALDVYAEHASPDALEPIVHAACAREAGCGGARRPEDCARALRGELSTRPGARLLRALRAEVATKLGECLERAPCVDDGALDRCASLAMAAAAGPPKGSDAGGDPPRDGRDGRDGRAALDGGVR
jgi:hypothetical protein